MSDSAELFVAVCSIAPTRRRRFLWAAWWTAPPTGDPFRPPDASHGGARTREEALAEAERVAGRSLVVVAPTWARAWSRVLLGEPPWPTATQEPRDASARAARPTPRPASPSLWSILGVPATATEREIKQAYRLRALETHPDRGGEPDAFRAVQDAYEAALRRREHPRKRRR